MARLPAAEREKVRDFLRHARADNPDMTPAEGKRKAEARFKQEFGSGFHKTYWHQSEPQEVEQMENASPIMYIEAAHEDGKVRLYVDLVDEPARVFAAATALSGVLAVAPKADLAVAVTEA